MDMDWTRDNSVVDLLRMCGAQDHGMARLRDALGVGPESGWQQRCLAEVADMVEAELDDIGTLARVRGEKLMEQDAMLASLIDCLKGDYRISAEWDGLRMVWTTEVDGDWCTARDDLVEELEAELEAEREEAAFWEGQHDAELNRRIKAEQRITDMERTHIELPVDADGVPIRPGDTLVRGKDMPFKVLSIDYNDDGVRVFNDNSFGIIHCEYRHAKPDHVKELLKELMGETVEWCHYSGPMSGTRTQGEIVADYAERIRKAVKDGD